ncbi:MAG: TatD family hydrolase [Candidatus Pacebacteria bacterium]|nr:TatD family hydrolase [Candidatus Paceibacterota bacterium]
MFKLFDSHCHLYMPQFDADRAEVLVRMQEAGMGAVVIGVDYASSQKALELAQQHDFLWSSVGLHPNDTPDEVFDMEKFEALARNPKVVAIGECGLDYFRSGGTEEEKLAQKTRFESHIELAEKVQKALVIHCRNAHNDCFSILQNSEIASKVPVVIHFFTGTAELAQTYLRLGCYLSFPGPVTYTDMYDESIKVTPLERMLIETDAPYAAPVPNRGKRNEPVFVEGVAQKIAALKGISVEEVLAQTAKNAQRAFGLR